MCKMSGQFALRLALEKVYLVIKIQGMHLSWSTTVFRKYHGNPLFRFRCVSGNFRLADRHCRPLSPTDDQSKVCLCVFETHTRTQKKKKKTFIHPAETLKEKRRALAGGHGEDTPQVTPSHTVLCSFWLEGEKGEKKYFQNPDGLLSMCSSVGLCVVNGSRLD